MVLVVDLAVIHQLEVDVKGWVKWTGDRCGDEWMVLVADLAVIRQHEVDVEGRVVGAGVIISK